MKTNGRKHPGKQRDLTCVVDAAKEALMIERFDWLTQIEKFTGKKAALWLGKPYRYFRGKNSRAERYRRAGVVALLPKWLQVK